MKKSLAMNVQIVTICLLLLTFIMMAQTYSKLVFDLGIIIHCAAALFQMAIGNIGLSFSGKRWIRAFYKIELIIVSIIALSMLMAPLFLNRQFVKTFLLVIIFATAGTFLLLILRGTRQNRD